MKIVTIKKKVIIILVEQSFLGPNLIRIHIFFLSLLCFFEIKIDRIIMAIDYRMVIVARNDLRL
jgi:hypothetical protein